MHMQVIRCAIEGQRTRALLYRRPSCMTLNDEHSVSCQTVFIRLVVTDGEVAYFDPQNEFTLAPTSRKLRMPSNGLGEEAVLCTASVAIAVLSLQVYAESQKR